MPPIDCSNAPTAPAGGLRYVHGQPRVIAAYTQTLIDAAALRGIAAPDLLAAAGVAAVGEEGVAASDYLALLAAAARLSGDPGFGLWIGRQVKPTTYGINGILLLACASLGEALHQVMQFEALVHDLGRSRIDVGDGALAYVWDCAWPGHPMEAQLVESVFAGIQTCAGWLAGRPLPVIRLTLRHRPTLPEAFYRQTLGCTVEFGQPENCAWVAADILEWPIPQADRSLFPLLRQHADELLARRHPKETGIVHQARQAMADQIAGDGGPRLDTVAPRLAVSVRTLQRKLAAAGTSFQQLLDDTRLELAEHYLAHTDQPIANIALLLGYQEPSSLNHAFKARHGIPPGTYREQRRTP